MSLNCTCLHPSVHGEQYLLKNPKLSLEIKDTSLFLLLFSSLVSGTWDISCMPPCSSQKLPPPTLSSGCLPPKPSNPLSTASGDKHRSSFHLNCCFVDHYGEAIRELLTKKNPKKQTKKQPQKQTNKKENKNPAT